MLQASPQTYNIESPLGIFKYLQRHNESIDLPQIEFTTLSMFVQHPSLMVLLIAIYKNLNALAY